MGEGGGEAGADGVADAAVLWGWVRRIGRGEGGGGRDTAPVTMAMMGLLIVGLAS